MTLFASARSKAISRAVVMAPFFEAAPPYEKPEYRYLLEAVSVLDTYNAPVPSDATISSSTLPAADIAGRLAMQEDITNNVWKNTDTCWIMAEDEGMADYTTAKNVYESHVQNNNSIWFAYP